MALALATPGAAFAKTATAAGKAVTVSPLSLVKTVDLDFGALIAGAVGGMAVVNASTDARTVTGGVVTAGGTPAAARFTAGGVAGLIAFITLPATISLSNGAQTMTVNTITTNGGTTRLFPGTATLDVRVGGTLNVAANQAQGSYAGTFDVTVIYF